ncbi:MAG: SPOR domain-containing protein [Hyphomicrobiaceae bacterium]
MTRSDNPFGDLPEWKERQRLQEAQGQVAGQPEFYHQPQGPEHGQAPQNGYPQGADPYDDRSTQHAPQQAPYYQDPAAGGAQLHYNVPNGGLAAAPAEYDPRHAQAMSTYDPQTQVTYPGAVNAPLPSEYAELGQRPTDYGAGHGQIGHGQQRVNDGLGLREGYYDDNNQYYAVGANGQPGAMPGFELNNYAPGQPDGRVADQAGYYDPVGRPGEQWNNGQMAAVAGQAPIGYDDDRDEDEDDYYDDDQEGGHRFSWKLLAAVVVTGAVVTGGGVVLYDSILGGGTRHDGQTPIVRADQRPAKTVPADAGGRKFANQDSKLLGRLDSSGSGKTAGNIDKPDVRNRVRSVPTVRIGADGRLILPKAPETVTAPPSSGNQAVAVGGQRIGPGINVVDSLGGGNVTGLGQLPKVVPPTNAREIVNAARAPRQPAAAPEVKPINSAPVAPAAAVETNNGRTNRATAPKSGPPPVPSKSSLGSAWRMTGAEASAQKQPNVGGIRPTIAQPAQPQPSRQVASRVQTASTLGASTLVKPQGGKGYVAVLATAPSRMKALQSFAELQQKHPSALLNRVPDVQKADLSARGLGIMYRVVVGPAGSRSSANSVCSSLKSEGYKGCWVKNN